MLNQNISSNYESHKATAPSENASAKIDYTPVTNHGSEITLAMQLSDKKLQSEKK